MAGRESSGNPSGGQAGRPRSAPLSATKAKTKRAGLKPGLYKERRKWERVVEKKTKRAGLKPGLYKERRKWERVVEKKNEKLRSKYRAVHGKVVDWVDHVIEDGYLFISIRFQDKTDFSMQFGAKIVTDEIDLCEVRSGNFRVVRQYFRRRGD